MDLFLGFTLKGLIPMEIFVHPYIPMILSTSSQCGTLFVYPTILPSNKGPSSLPSNDYPSVHSLPTKILCSNALEAHALHGTPPASRAFSNRAHPWIPLWYYEGSPPSFRHSKDSSTWLALNLALIPLEGLSGHHISPQWYDIINFGPKPSWICFWALP